MVPTEIQQAIIDNPGNTVVLASPGSGKTFVMSEKIRKVLNGNVLLEYQGVIAISYTRKASSNLKNRTLTLGTSSRYSYFGTIDSFCLTQIILPFGNYVFGHPECDVTPISLNDLSGDIKADYEWIDEIHPAFDSINEYAWDKLKTLFQKGSVLIQALELLSLYIIKNCLACRKYLSSRYRYVFIDEYQDADCYTDGVFHELLKLGLIGVAVGDANQSIFGFAHKESKYLKALQQEKGFTSYTLKENHRCSLPIINYSNRLLDPNSTIIETSESGVYLLKVDGGEVRVAEILNEAIPKLCDKYNIDNKSGIAILVWSGKVLKILDDNLTIPHRILETTDLDKDMNLRSKLYAQLLQFYFDKKMPFLQIVDDYLDYGLLPNSLRNRLIELGNNIRNIAEKNIHSLEIAFHSIADILLPHIKDGPPIVKLKAVLADSKLLDTYKPLDKDEIVILTLHKSKGLEFDVVFHMNLNEWEMPYQKIINSDFKNPKYPDWEQNLNLHYVGITRAKKQCFLITTTKRINSNGEEKTGKPSKFLQINDLDKLRKDYNV